MGVRSNALELIENGERPATAKEVVLVSEKVNVSPDRILRRNPDPEMSGGLWDVFNELIDDYFGIKALLP